MKHELTPLLSRSVRAGIGDPWYFESRAGPNLLEGIVEAVPPNGAGYAWLLCSVHPFWHHREKIEQVVVVAMHDDHCPLSMLLRGRRVPAKMVFDPMGAHLGTHQEAALLLTRPSRESLIGTIELARSWSPSVLV